LIFSIAYLRVFCAATARAVKMQRLVERCFVAPQNTAFGEE
jgi:hypothetical protein